MWRKPRPPAEVAEFIAYVNAMPEFAASWSSSPNAELNPHAALAYIKGWADNEIRHLPPGHWKRARGRMLTAVGFGAYFALSWLEDGPGQGSIGNRSSFGHSFETLKRHHAAREKRAAKAKTRPSNVLPIRRDETWSK